MGQEVVAYLLYEIDETGEGTLTTQNIEFTEVFSLVVHLIGGLAATAECDYNEIVDSLKEIK